MDKCQHGFDIACLMCGFSNIDGQRVWFDWAWQEQQKQIEGRDFTIKAMSRSLVLVNAEVDELQAECDQLEMQILRSRFFRAHEYSNQNIERLWREFIKKSHRCIECSNFDVCSCGDELEQALKGGQV